MFVFIWIMVSPLAVPGKTFKSNTELELVHSNVPHMKNICTSASNDFATGYTL